MNNRLPSDPMDIRVPRKKPQPPPKTPPHSAADPEASFLLRALDTLALDPNHEDTIAVENVWKKGLAMTTQSVPSVPQVTAFVGQMFVLHFRKVDHHEYLNWDFRAPDHRRINKTRLLNVLPPPLPAMLKYGAVRKCVEDYFDLNLTHMSSAVRKLVCAVHSRMFELKLVRDEDLQFQNETAHDTAPAPAAPPPTQPQPRSAQPASTWYDNRMARRREAEQQQQTAEDSSSVPRQSSSLSKALPPPNSAEGQRRSPSDRRGGGPPTIEPRRSVWDDRRRMINPSAAGKNGNDSGLGGCGSEEDGRSRSSKRLSSLTPSNKMTLGVLDGSIPSGTRVIGDKRETSFAGLGVKRVVRNGHNGWLATFELDDDDLSDDEVPAERRNIITTKRVEFTPSQYGSEDAAKIAAEAFVFKVEKGCQTDLPPTPTPPTDTDHTHTHTRPPSSRVKREVKLTTAANWRPNPVWNPIAHCSTCSCTDSTDIHCRTCCCRGGGGAGAGGGGPSRRQIRNGPDLVTKVALRRASPYWDSWFESLWRSSPPPAAATAADSAASSTTFPSFDLLTTQVSTADIDNALLN